MAMAMAARSDLEDSILTSPGTDTPAREEFVSGGSLSSSQSPMNLIIICIIFGISRARAASTSFNFSLLL